MTHEDKNLLMKDLCGRLPYEVKGFHRGEVQRLLLMDSFGSYQVNGYDAWFNLNSVEFKPYLRPMSSMTKDEYKEYDEFEFISASHFAHGIEAGELTDWLNAHHFDYRGLIGKGLALEAPEGMYN